MKTNLADLLHFFRFRQHVFNRPLHVESLLRNIVVLAIANALEALDGIGQLHILTLNASELLRHVRDLAATYLLDSSSKISATCNRSTGAWSTAVCQTRGQ